MVDELHSLRTRSQRPESRSRPALTHSTHSALFQSLQSLRERVLKRLDSLENLARERSAPLLTAGASAGLERTLELKMAELAETEQRLHDQAERQAKEWSASLIKLESDRRLVAEAWERVERERVAYSGAPEQPRQNRAQIQGPPRGARANAQNSDDLVTTRSAEADSDSNQPVAQAILRQFQTLGNDVRRNSEERRDSRSEGSRPES